MHLAAVTFEARDPAALAVFWGGLLGRTPVTEADDVLLPESPTQVGLRFVTTPAQAARGRTLHLHVLGESHTSQVDLVEAALALGGAHLDVGQLPEEPHVVLADPEGNPFCVIPSDSGFLRGCGPLGEVGCDGTREVGMFWAAALGWPLVWDEHGETAIQAPAGGTKVAWGGSPVAPKRGRNPQRFDLLTSPERLTADIGRLVDLGARRLGHVADGAELADPDGNEFRVRAESGQAPATA
ncbi:VOC family protein [Nocardioides acrostichi]|uniref:VOC family protein n=1 Tax=Nocardioides acrostichi TaxID=2784339 RepID=A0A930YCQ6_9ACTN|nr:VOC family protein [Nocardioides acrostichi]MBF4161679.1 VOC family protein [Nocardioides acrostichi]